jgi:hypothetical protein
MAHLSVLVAEFGEDIPYAGGLERGFPFRGARVPFLNRQKGIYRAAVQSGPAALAIQTSAKSPYDGSSRTPCCGLTNELGFTRRGAKIVSRIQAAIRAAR